MARRTAKRGGQVRSLTPRKPGKLARPESFAGSVLKYLDKSDVVAAVNTLRDGMKATKNEKVSRYTYAEVIDHGTRMSAAKMILEYTFGKPDVRLQVDDTRNGEPVTKAESAAQIAQRLKGSGLNLDDIIEAHAMAAKPVEEVGGEEAAEESE